MLSDNPCIKCDKILKIAKKNLCKTDPCKTAIEYQAQRELLQKVVDDLRQKSMDNFGCIEIGNHCTQMGEYLSHLADAYEQELK